MRMLDQRSFGSLAIVAALLTTMLSAQAQDMSKYPDWSGIWRGIGGNQWDPSKPIGLPQQAPLTPEYQAIFEASLADQKLGGQGNNVRYTCMPSGMPRTMTVLFQIEFVITPKTTYLMFANNPSRRIHTDGRAWPKEMEPAFTGYSIGQWIDTDGDGRYDVLEAETRFIRGHRTYDNTGLPFHEDNATIVKERIYGDKAKPEKIVDEITTIDHALTRPWTVTKTYIREKTDVPWIDIICGEANPHVVIGKENYFMSWDGYLMPARKNQAPPDLRYFNQMQK
jgi:hypothetical protein